MKYLLFLLTFLLVFTSGFSQSKKKQIEALQKELKEHVEYGFRMKKENDSIKKVLRETIIAKKNYQKEYVYFLQKYNQANTEVKTLRKVMQNYEEKIDSLGQLTNKYVPKSKRPKPKAKNTSHDPSSPFGYFGSSGGNGDGVGYGSYGSGTGNPAIRSTNLKGSVSGTQHRRIRGNVSKTRIIKTSKYYALTFELIISEEGKVLDAKLIKPDKTEIDEYVLFKAREILIQDLNFFPETDPQKILPQEFRLQIFKRD